MPPEPPASKAQTTKDNQVLQRELAALKSEVESDSSELLLLIEAALKSEVESDSSESRLLIEAQEILADSVVGRYLERCRSVEEQLSRFEELLEAEVGDRFARCNVTVPPLSSQTVRNVPKVDELIDAVLGRVNMGGVHHLNQVVCAYGEGGIGKTTACTLAANDQEVRDAFTGGVYFIKLRLSSSDKDGINQLGHIVRLSGGVARSSVLHALSGRGGLQKAVELTSEWFKDRNVLIVVDNVWRRVGCGYGEAEWIETLSSIAATSGSCLLFSTRDRGLAESAGVVVEFDRLDINTDSGFAIARSMFDLYTTRAPNDAHVVDIWTHLGYNADGSGLEYTSVADDVVKLCDGWPAAISAAGAFARYDVNTFRAWDRFRSRVDRRLIMGRDWEHGKSVYDIWKAIIDFIQEQAAQPSDLDNSAFYGLRVKRMRELFGDKWLERQVAALAIYDSRTPICAGVIALQLGVDKDQGEAFVRFCAWMGLGRVVDIREADRKGSREEQDGSKGTFPSVALQLHDLQKDHALMLIRRSESDAPRIFESNRRLLQNLASLDRNPEEENDPIDWAKAVRRSGVRYGCAVREYFLAHLPMHLCRCVSSCTTGDDARSTDSGEDDTDRLWADRVTQLIADYRWLRYCTENMERSQFLASLRVAIDYVGTAWSEGESGRSSEYQSRSYVRDLFTRGQQEAAFHIFWIVEITTLELTMGHTGSRYREYDRDFAGRLYRRLSTHCVAFLDLPGEDRNAASELVEGLLSGISDSAHRT